MLGLFVLVLYHGNMCAGSGPSGSYPVGRVVSTRAYGSGDRGPILMAGRAHIFFRKRLKTVGAVLEHDAH